MLLLTIILLKTFPIITATSHDISSQNLVFILEFYGTVSSLCSFYIDFFEVTVSFVYRYHDVYVFFLRFITLCVRLERDIRKMEQILDYFGIVSLSTLYYTYRL